MYILPLNFDRLAAITIKDIQQILAQTLPKHVSHSLCWEKKFMLKYSDRTNEKNARK